MSFEHLLNSYSSSEISSNSQSPKDEVANKNKNNSISIPITPVIVFIKVLL